MTPTRKVPQHMTSVEQTPHPAEAGAGAGAEFGVESVAEPGEQVLDAPVWASLTGPHAHFAQGNDVARRYPPDVSPFLAIAPGVPPAEAWPAVYDLVGPGVMFGFFGPEPKLDPLPEGWSLPLNGVGVQLVATAALETAPAPEAVVLGADDVPDMLDLVERTQPGPFLPRTHEVGTYLGIRRGGALVAMAGERLRPPGYTEISAVCTDASVRGQGLATLLVRAVAHGIRARGDVPFLHSAATNHNAIRLYESLGFRRRRQVGFFAIRTPGDAADTDLATAPGLHPEAGPA
jgi:ribosomal protein S18 acetylase RimI-like enzyme